jgi:hypothetical protein
MFDQFGGYVLRGYVDRQLMLEEWGHTYANAWLHGQHFIAERAAHDGGRWSGWPHLRDLGPAAVEWSTAHSSGMPPSHRETVAPGPGDHSER